MPSFLDVCRFTAASSGTGDFVVSAAVTGYQTPASAGAVNAAIYRYRAESADLLQWEVGYGAYTSGSTTLARTTVLYNSSGTTSKINFSAAPEVAVVALAEDWVSTVPQCGRLQYSSATALTYLPFNGNQIKINGIIYPFSSVAGLANTSVFVNGVGASNLAASTLYYVYAFVNSGVITADFSTTARATSTTAGNEGVEIKNGDDTRSLIGLIRTNGSSQFADSASNRFVISWFNRKGIAGKNNFTANRTTTSSTYVEINSEIRCEFVIWSDETIDVNATGPVSNGTINGHNDTSFGFNGTTAEDVDAQCQAYTGGATLPLALSMVKGGLTEGYNYVTLLGKGNGTTGTWFGNATAGTRVAITFGMRG